MAQIGSVGGKIWQNGSEKWSSRRGQLDTCAAAGTFQTQLLWIAWEICYIIGVILKCASCGAHTQSTFQKYPCVGPQLTPSAIFCSQYEQRFAWGT